MLLKGGNDKKIYFIFSHNGEKNEVCKIEKNEGITCVCLMGGDKTPELINTLAEYIHEAKGLKTGWYSGKDELSDKIDLKWFNYVKIGHYDEKLGPLNKETTNQRFYLIEDKKPKDITYKFWKKRDQ